MTNIDYEAIVKQLIQENEKLRINLLKAYSTPIISYEEIVQYLKENYQVLLLLTLWLSVVVEVISVFIRSKRHER